MRRQPYPLQSVQTLREARQQSAEQACAKHERERLLLAEKSHLPPGGRTVAELQQQVEYAKHLSEQSRKLERKRVRAERLRDERRAELERAQQELQEAFAERKAVESHRQQMEAGQSRQAELKEEMEAEEVHGAFRRGT
jgi:hypothetical protein